MKKISKNSLLAYLGFMTLMIALGASDAMRGVFVPLFGDHFSLSNAQLSLMITISYVGNLVFLLLGGRIADRANKKAAFLAAALLWLAAVISYLITDSYPALLIGMFFSMGASTLTSTLINVMTPFIFAAAPAAIVSTLFFIQGIGTTGSQRLAGKFATGMGSWKIANLILLILGVTGIILMLFVRFPAHTESSDESEQKSGYGSIFRNKAFIFLVLIFGSYFIAEHSVMNWFVTIGTKGMGLTLDRASTGLSIFFGGIMIGRLVFAPVVQKLGVKKSILIFSGIAAILFGIGGMIGRTGLTMLIISGLFFSVLYPTTVMLIQSYYPVSSVTTATGVIISTATLFDIGWNAVYGILLDTMDAGKAFIFPAAAIILFFVLSVTLIASGKKKKEA